MPPYPIFCYTRGCGKPAVGCKVLGVRDRDVLAEEVKGLFPYGVQLRKLTGVEKICAVHDNFQARAFDFVQKTTGFGGGIDHVGKLGLDAQGQVVFFSHFERLVDSANEGAPGIC